jgi:hypothetical protein
MISPASSVRLLPCFRYWDHQSEATLLRQTGIGVAMHGCIKPGLLGRTLTCSGLRPPCTEQPVETEHLVAQSVEYQPF